MRRRPAPAPPPSYRAGHFALRRVRDRMRETYGVPDPVWRINDKLAFFDWADRVGVPHPAVLNRWDHPSDIDWTALPADVVLKPERGSSDAGVFVLARRADDFLDLASGGNLTPSAITAELIRLSKSGRVSGAGHAEERIVDAVTGPERRPRDWKVWAFYGRPVLALAKEHPGGGKGGRNGGRKVWRAFDAQWNDLGRALGGHTFDLSIPPPAHPGGLLRLAALVSACIPAPFVRVDLFDATGGPVVGEITPMPGTDLDWRPDVDRLLGEAWEDASARLAVRAARLGSGLPGVAPDPEALQAAAPFLAVEAD